MPIGKEKQTGHWVLALGTASVDSQPLPVSCITAYGLQGQANQRIRREWFYTKRCSTAMRVAMAREVTPNLL